MNFYFGSRHNLRKGVKIDFQLVVLAHRHNNPTYLNAAAAEVTLIKRKVNNGA